MPLRWHRPLMLFCGALGVLAVVCVAGLAFDDRVLMGEPIWLKPLKFCLSFIAFGTVIAWILPLMRRTPGLARLAGNLLVTAGIIEIVLIVTQVLRGRRSHFNESTPLDAAIFGVMGLTITFLWITSIGIGVLALRQRLADRPTTTALRLALVLSVIGMAVAFLMVGPTPEQSQALADGTFNGVMGAHSVGVPDGGPGMPLTDWSTTGGDLRVPHAVGLHALQAIPLVAVILSLAGRRVPALRDEGVRVGLIRVAAAGYLALVALLTWQALRGQPLVRPDAAVLGGLALIAAAVAAGSLAVLLTRRRRPVAPVLTPVPEAGVR
ncbi:hypothetical protein [Microbispora sp. ATCC PTA-5024]|uniref:hypothetical protein n=1 Tax=Microbispora sp. ATCC PTA-5024 TaxID=316330 RepID=UPI0003DDAE96|nr:hypothetical protein [Microbispora sp. ATCC PTA-5024]ETK36553.1 hypothetical protein MPTA5024_08525 [Microbispora sp. ATCC PTA-5024]